MATAQNTSLTALHQAKGRSKIVALTAYDALTAQLVDLAGADMMLVGDSLAMVALGESSTLKADHAMMMHHLRAVLRAHPKMPVVVDMPFPGLAVSETDLLQAACEFMRAGADAVKVEGTADELGKIACLRQAGIPVLGHIGLLPQRVLSAGGYRKFGKTEEEADALMRDALAFQKQGAFGIVLEMVDEALAKEITEALDITTIGIGSGDDCDGYIQVTTDLLNLSFGRIPSFVSQVADLKTPAVAGLKEFIADKKR